MQSSTLARIIIVMAYTTIFATTFILFNMTWEYIYSPVPLASFDLLIYSILLSVGLLFIVVMWKLASVAQNLVDSLYHDEKGSGYRT